MGVINLKECISSQVRGVPWIFKLLARERSERDTYRGNTIENRGCLFIYLFIGERA